MREVRVAIHAGYLVDLEGVQFDDETSGTWIHAMGLGKFHHPMYGQIDLTPERIKRFADNFANRVRGIDIAIDYDHRAHGGDAAGWVRKAEPRSDGLWLFVEWTKSAYQKLKEKAYKYFSPEFLDEWEHPETRIKFKDVLFGGGITNRPFLKNLVPINMTEFVNHASGGQSMDANDVLKELAKKLGLPEDTDPGVILGTLIAKLPDDKEKEEEEGGGGPPGGEQKTPEQIAADEKAAADAKALAEKDKGKDDKPVVLDEAALMQLPFVKTLMETVQNQGKKLDEDQVGKDMVALDEKAASKKVAIPPTVKEGLKKQLSELPPSQRPGLIKLFEGMIEAGQVGVKLGENGHSGHEQSKTAADAYETAVTKKMTESQGKLTYADAAMLVAGEQPQMYVEYQRELANS
jgi:phage I-like protein